MIVFMQKEVFDLVSSREFVHIFSFDLCVFTGHTLIFRIELWKKKKSINEIL